MLEFYLQDLQAWIPSPTLASLKSYVNADFNEIEVEITGVKYD